MALNSYRRYGRVGRRAGRPGSGARADIRTSLGGGGYRAEPGALCAGPADRGDERDVVCTLPAVRLPRSRISLIMRLVLTSTSAPATHQVLWPRYPATAAGSGRRPGKQRDGAGHVRDDGAGRRRKRGPRRVPRRPGRAHEGQLGEARVRVGAWIGPQDVACNISYTMALRSWTLAGQSSACMVYRERLGGRLFSACLSSLLPLLQVGRVLPANEPFPVTRLAFGGLPWLVIVK